MRSVAGIKREAENVGGVASGERLCRLGQAARARIVHDRTAGRPPEGVREMKARHTAGVRELCQCERPVEMCAASMFPITPLHQCSLSAPRLIEIALNCRPALRQQLDTTDRRSSSRECVLLFQATTEARSTLSLTRLRSER